MRSFAERILCEDNHLLIVNKLCSELAQGDAATSPGDLVKVLADHRPSGAISIWAFPIASAVRPAGRGIPAKTESPDRLNALLRGKVDKTYWAIIDKAPPEIEAPLVNNLVKDGKTNKSRALGQFKKGSGRFLLYHHRASAELPFARNHLGNGRHHQIEPSLHPTVFISEVI